MNVHPLVKTVLFNKEQIQRRVKELAQDLDLHYQHSSEPVILIGILRGCINFLNDLMMNMEIECNLDFMYVVSFFGNTEALSHPEIKVDIFNDIKGRDVVIVEDIIDSGKTLLKITEYLKTKKPKSLKIITFLDKKCKRKVNLNADWSGFEVDDYFLIGYGLDYQEILRNLPYIAVADLEKINNWSGNKNKN